MIIIVFKGMSLKEMLKNLQKFQTDNNFCDVTLVCEDKQIKLHKLIISSFSPVLRNILKINQATHPLIYLRKVKYTNLHNLFIFMYEDEVFVAKEDLLCFLEVFEDLNIRFLSEKTTERGKTSCFEGK